MLESPSNNHPRAAQAMLPAEPGGLQSLYRYASAVWNRISIVLLCIAVFCSAGLLYFILSPRVYESQAEVLIRSIARDDRMVLSDPVLEDAIQRLQKEGVVDFTDIPVDERAEALRQRLILRKPGGRPDIIQLRCRSNRPEETVAILDAVVASYRAYMGLVDTIETSGHPNDPGLFAARMLDLLLKKKSEIERRMAKSRAELFDEMRKLEQKFEPEKSAGTGVPRPSTGAAPTRRSDEPGRIVAPARAELVPPPNRLEKDPERILRFQMLAYENRLLGMLRSLVDDLADNAEEAKRKKAKAEVIQKPIVPTEPIAPRKVTHILFAATVFGTALGLAIVFLLDALDDRIRSRAELNGLLPVPIVGTLANPEAPQPAGTPAPDIQATAQHCIPATLAIDALRSDTPVLVLTRVNDDEQNSRIAERLAETYRLKGNRVLLIESGNTQSVHGAAVDSGLSRVLASTRGVAEALQETIENRPGDIGTLDVLPGGPDSRLDASRLFSDRLPVLLELIAEKYDRVIIDTPPARSATVAAIIGRLVGGTLLVVNPQYDSRADARTATETLQLHGCAVWGVAIDARGVQPAWWMAEFGAMAGVAHMENRRAEAQSNSTNEGRPRVQLLEPGQPDTQDAQPSRHAA